MLTLERLNQCDAQEFVALLDGIYEDSPWVAARTASARPFTTYAALKHALQRTVRQADSAQQLALIRAHPELAGAQAAAGTLTRESSAEQAGAGLAPQAGADASTEAELTQLRALNAAYRARFDFPFVLAVKGHDGRGMPRATIIATLQRRLNATPAAEQAESLRQIGRIAELRLNQRCAVMPALGAWVLARCEDLAQASDTATGLSCPYLGASHHRCALQLQHWMEEAGLQVERDPIGNVVGRYRCGRPAAKTLLLGSHYDSVVDAGKFRGRIGILLALAALRTLLHSGQGLPFDVEIIGFADEAGGAYQDTPLGSSALAGRFDPAVLEQVAHQGNSLAMALHTSGPDTTQTVADTAARIAGLARQPQTLLGFIEIDIEAGTELLEHDLPVGVASSLADGTRSSAGLTAGLSAAIVRTGLAPVALACKVGRQALVLQHLTGVALLLIRCGNGGISHHPLEIVTADDLDLAARILIEFLRELPHDFPTHIG